MLSNYLTIIFRNLKRQPGYSFINIAGLAAGMAAFVLIALFVQNEFSFDKDNPNADDVYRVILDARVAGQEIITVSSPAVMAGAFLETFPEVIDATRVNSYSADVLITVGDTPYYESNYFQADSSVFRVFGFEMLKGNPETALNRPNTLVISESVARKYFGQGDAVGQTIRYSNAVDYEITGVMADPPTNAHFQPKLLGSFLTNREWDSTVWLNNSFSTYVQLRPGADPEELQSKFPEFLRTNVGPQIEQFMGLSYDEAIAAGLKYDWPLERVSEIYLYSRASDQTGPTGDIRYLYILGIIAAFVLLIACINFMNLSTARATGRAREVGVRKALGSQRRQLIGQFLGESVAMALLSMVVAFGLVALALPFFSALAGAQLTVQPALFLWILGTALLTGVVAGLYPAVVLSSFRPAVVLKGSFSAGRQGVKLRSALVVFQFAITIVLLIGTSIVFKQLRFIENQELGFDASQIVVVPIETQAGVSTFPTFRAELLSHAAIEDAAATGVLPGPGRIHNNTGFRGDHFPEGQFFIAGLGEVTDDFVETLGLKIIAGRDFDASFPSDSSGWVINEATAAALGFSPDEAIGKGLARLDASDNRLGTIVGVAANAHFTSLHGEVGPLVFGRLRTNQRYVPIRIRSEDTADALAFIEEKWTAYEPGFPFRYFFMDSDYQKFYEREQRLSGLYLYFTVLAVLIACLGLFGLASYVTTQRTREIGVRKALGASTGGIVLLLSREFTLLVVVACGLAFPVAWYAMTRWLESFAYATSIGVWVFVGAGAFSLAIAWLTVSYQSVRSAMADPVTALHHQ